jgi:hypothetical protein
MRQDMETKSYKCTDKAGDWVAGKRKPEDGMLQLTEEQARYELLNGTIEAHVPVEPAVSVPAKYKPSR